VYAGTYGEKHMKEQHFLLPVDFSYRFFTCAQPDLQVEGYLRGDEKVDLLKICLGAREWDSGCRASCQN